MYICIYVYIHAYICIYTHTHANTALHDTEMATQHCMTQKPRANRYTTHYVYPCICTHIHTCIYIYIHTCLNRDGNTALHEAAARNYMQVATRLIASGMLEIDRVNTLGRTALHTAVSNRHLTMVCDV